MGKLRKYWIATAMVASMQIGAQEVLPTKLGTENANPLQDFLFTADPTAVEHEGRLYVYGTNDHEQYEKAEKNSYEQIKSLAMLSTDDMANWTYHGLIPVGEIAPWIMNSWAPSVVSRVEEDGQRHFYLYFSNSGFGTGVLTATSPVGPWTSPRENCLVDANTEGLGDCKVPFDPGAVIDEQGQGWIAFGAGKSRLAKLGKDMVSIDGEFVTLPAVHHFEANELNYINGTYVYTYNLDWDEHLDWTLSGEIPTRCCMSYMTSKTPQDSASWHYENLYLKNPGDYGFDFSNNHTHLHKFQGKWYLFYHTMMLQKSFGTEGGFRSMCVEEAEVDEERVHIGERAATTRGVKQTKWLNPYRTQQAETVAATQGVKFAESGVAGNMLARVGTPSIMAPQPKEGILEVRGVDFEKGCKRLMVKASGYGQIEVRLDTPLGKPIAHISTNGTEMQQWQTKCRATGVHRVFFTLGGDVAFDEWIFQ